MPIVESSPDYPKYFDLPIEEQEVSCIRIDLFSQQITPEDSPTGKRMITEMSSQIQIQRHDGTREIFEADTRQTIELIEFIREKTTKKGEVKFIPHQSNA